MRFELDGLDVFFPYDKIYHEQYEYMLNLKRAIDARGHALLEMPTGTGKTVCLVSLITSYQYQYPLTGKLIYCTRTVQEMYKTMEEIKRVIKYRASILGQAGEKVLALCLSSRKNMCIHPRVEESMEGAGDREAVDTICRSMTASWVRSRAESNPSGNHTLCEFYESFQKNGTTADLPSGVYNLDDLKELGHSTGWCPYFLARYLLTKANVIVYNYSYMLDPKVAGLISKELEAESIVVFDEAHNIDNVCIESLSVVLDKKRADLALKGANRLSAKVAEMVTMKKDDLRKGYEELRAGLIQQGVLAADVGQGNPALLEDQLQEAVPGCIRKNEHFVAMLKKLCVYVKSLLEGKVVEVVTALSFLRELENKTALERKPLKFTSSRLSHLLRTLEIAGLDEFSALTEVANFCTLLSTYPDEGFNVVMEPQGTMYHGVNEPLLQLCCNDASIAIKPVLERFRSVIITSGTLSPIGDYAKILNFAPKIKQQLPMSTFRDCILPLVITRGSDQIPISSKFELRMKDEVIRNYGQLLIDVCSVVPDGVCAFFTSYSYMEVVIDRWREWKILDRIMEHKLIFLETKDVLDTTQALANFKRSCDVGRGAVFISIARGKVAEGVDFDRHYGRCVLLFGIPIQYTQSHVLRARMAYMLDKYKIREQDFLTFDALRQSAQCIGRVIRSKEDYGIVIFADYRFNKTDKRSKLPPWVTQFLREEQMNLTTDMAMEHVQRFLKEMGQPTDRAALEAIVLTEDQVKAKNAKACPVRVAPAAAAAAAAAASLAPSSRSAAEHLMDVEGVEAVAPGPGGPQSAAQTGWGQAVARAKAVGGGSGGPTAGGGAPLQKKLNLLLDDDDDDDDDEGEDGEIKPRGRGRNSMA